MRASDLGGLSSSALVFSFLLLVLIQNRGAITGRILAAQGCQRNGFETEFKGEEILNCLLESEAISPQFHQKLHKKREVAVWQV